MGWTQTPADTITIDKLRSLYACLQSDHYTASEGNGLLSRAVGKNMEMLALAAGYRLIKHEVSQEEVRTDCDSARQVIHDGYARLCQGDCAQRVLLQSILRAVCTTNYFRYGWKVMHTKGEKPQHLDS